MIDPTLATSRGLDRAGQGTKGPGKLEEAERILLACVDATEKKKCCAAVGVIPWYSLVYFQLPLAGVTSCPDQFRPGLLPKVDKPPARMTASFPTGGR